MGFFPPVSRLCTRPEKAPDKNVSTEEANISYFFNCTSRSATSNSFSSLLNRSFLLFCQKVQPQPSQSGLAKLLLLPAASHCSTAVAAPSLPQQHPRARHSHCISVNWRHMKNSRQRQLAVHLSHLFPKSFSPVCRLPLTPKAYHPLYSPVRL